MLFTADLRTFSEKLVEKIESTAVENGVEVESDAIVHAESVTRLQVSRKRVRRANEGTQREEILVEEDKFSKIKRRRKR